VAAGQGRIGQGADAISEHTVVVADQDPHIDKNSFVSKQFGGAFWICYSVVTGYSRRRRVISVPLTSINPDTSVLFWRIFL
jgi:hypothetical protein